MSVFATVGTTRFDALVEVLDTIEVPSPFEAPSPANALHLPLRAPPPLPNPPARAL